MSEMEKEKVLVHQLEEWKMLNDYVNSIDLSYQQPFVIIMAIIAGIATLLGENFSEELSFVYFIFPIGLAAVTAHVSYQFRITAILRGHLARLEERMNERLGENVHMWNSALVETYMAHNNHINSFSKPDLVAFDYYGKEIHNHELLMEMDKASRAFQSIGIQKDDLVFMLCINMPEVAYCMYSLNRIGAVTEWFNPTAISAELLRKYILESKVRYIVAIDLMYSVLTKAIEGTSVEKVILLSVKDSFSAKMRTAYNIQVYGTSALLKILVVYHIERFFNLKACLCSRYS